MKKLIISILYVVVLLSLASCGTTEDACNIQTKQISVISALSNSYENGIIYLDNNIYNFYDYNSNVTIPLCFKPNCTHSDNQCIAKRLSESSDGISVPVVFQDNLYYFKVTESIEGDGENTTYFMQSKLYKCDLKSGEETDILTVSDIDCTSSVNMVRNDSMLYFIASNGAYQFEDGTWAKAGCGKQYLCSVDLEHCCFENYGLVNDSPYASNNVVITGSSIHAVEDQVIIAGVYDDKIYLYYPYVEDQNMIINAIDNQDFQIDWNYAVKAFQFGDQNMCEMKEQPPICLNADWYVTEDQDNRTIAAKEKAGNTVAFESENTLIFDCYQYAIYNNIIWDLYNGKSYDLLAKKTYDVKDDLIGAYIVDYIAKDKQYVISNYNSSGELRYERLGIEEILVME